MSWLKRIGRSPVVQQAAGSLIASYFSLVWKTASVTHEPPDLLDRIDAALPVIYAMWHGQHFLTPVAKRRHPTVALISRSRDGEINAIAAEKMGVGTIRGSGAPDHRKQGGKGGVAAFRDMVEALEGGTSVALTADVPKVAKRCGLGIIMVAKLSGRPIVPVAIATKRRIDLRSWDKTALNLPFSKAAVVMEPFITVPHDADDATLGACRLKVEEALNRATARAYALAEGRA